MPRAHAPLRKRPTPSSSVPRWSMSWRRASTRMAKPQKRPLRRSVTLLLRLPKGCARPGTMLPSNKRGIMNWISNVVRPKIPSFLNRRETPENLWIKSPESGQLVFYKDVEANQFVIPGSNYHMRMSATARLKTMFDGETWLDIGIPEVQIDPLKFRDQRRYTDRLKDARTRTGLNDAIKLGFGKLDGLPVVIGVQDFDFMGGSLGMAAGEAVVKGL